MSQQVTTEFGTGRIVASETNRGNTSYKVEGEGFSVWLTAAQISDFGQLDWDPSIQNRVNYENSTTLPYNPQPQFLPHSGESTIQPNQHLDTNKRLTPADSVTFEGRPEVNRFPRNFTAGLWDVNDGVAHIVESIPGGALLALDVYAGPDGVFRAYFRDERGGSDFVELSATDLDLAIEEAEPILDQRLLSASKTASDQAGTADTYEDTVYPSPVVDEEYPGGTNTPGDHSFDQLNDAHDEVTSALEANGVAVQRRETGDQFGFHTDCLRDFQELLADAGYNYMQEFVDMGPLFGSDWECASNNCRHTASRHAAVALSEVQARLGDKYIDIPHDVDRSLQARLDDDPYRVVSDVKVANFEANIGTDSRRVQAQLDLEQADPQIREAAWADVRAKATRLRRSGAVQLDAANSTAIIATVTGDHGVYDVAVLRGSALTGNSAVQEWSCSCPWGDWAFERERTFVGRLCSHAYAAFQELRALTMRKEKPKDWNHPAVDGWVRSSSQMDPRDGAPPLPEAARHPRDDGRLSAEPGSQGFNTNNIPQTHEVSRANVEEGTPYPYGTVAGRHTANAFDDFMDFSGGDTSQEQFDSYCDYRELTGRPVTDSEVEELNSVGVSVHAFLDDPLVGTGTGQQPDSYGTSEDYVNAHERGHRVDITEDAGNPVQPNGDDARVADRQVTAEANHDDLVAAAQSNGWTAEVDTNNAFGELASAMFRYGDDLIVSVKYRNAGLGLVGSAHLSTQDPLGWAASGLATATDGDTVLGWLSAPASYITASVPDNGLNEDGTDDPDLVSVDEGNDIVAAFQRNAGAHLLGSGSDSPVSGADDFAGAAERFLRTAGRNFTLAEQQALMDEEAVGGPLDQSELDLGGTHYLG